VEHRNPDTCIVSHNELGCRQWELLVVVRTVQLLEGEDKPRGNKKVVFIGKPLPPKSANAMEKNRLAFKTAARSIFHSWDEDKKVFADRPVTVPEVSHYERLCQYLEGT
jgi:hypothetical protein